MRKGHFIVKNKKRPVSSPKTLYASSLRKSFPISRRKTRTRPSLISSLRIQLLMRTALPPAVAHVVDTVKKRNDFVVFGIYCKTPIFPAAFFLAKPLHTDELELKKTRKWPFRGTVYRTTERHVHRWLHRSTLVGKTLELGGSVCFACFARTRVVLYCSGSRRLVHQLAFCLRFQLCNELMKRRSDPFHSPPQNPSMLSKELCSRSLRSLV